MTRLTASNSASGFDMLDSGMVAYGTFVSSSSNSFTYLPNDTGEGGFDQQYIVVFGSGIANNSPVPTSGNIGSVSIKSTIPKPIRPTTFSMCSSISSRPAARCRSAR